MKFRPLSDHVVIERLEAPDKSKGGIILPDISKEKPTEGKVLAVGPGKVSEAGVRIPLEVKVGDRVLFSRYGTTEIEIEGSHVTTVHEHDILAVLED